tara:strand:+ start:736 stop:954 length:219 start_codon:yes stop_codon:yes gene_type:complete
MKDLNEYVVQELRDEVSKLKASIKKMKVTNLDKYQKGFFMGFERAKCNPQSRNVRCEWLHVVELHGLKRGAE